MDLKALEGFQEANQCLLEHMTPRAQHLAMLERWVDGTQYEGRASWFDDSKPLFERAPAVVYGVLHTAIDSNRSLTLGDGRFPAVTSRPGEDDETFDADLGLDEDDSDVVDFLIDKAFTQLRFRKLCREVFEHAMGHGTGVALFGARNGRLFADTLKARWCTPTFDNDRRVTRLDVEYPYLDTVRRPDGTWVCVAKLYRRTIDDKTDTSFEPVELRPGKLEVPNGKGKSYAHGLGFCPVVWYPFMAGASIEGQIDGRALHWQESTRQLIEAFDFAVSQRHRAALFSGDPLTCEFGVEPGSSPSGMGRQPRQAAATPQGGKPTADNPLLGKGDPTAGYVNLGSGEAKGRKKGPGIVWQYQNVQSRVEQLTLPAGALESIDANARDLRDKIAERLQVVFLDPEHVRGITGISGKALEVLKERQLDACGEYREDFGEGFLLPATDMVLRICHELRGTLRLSGIKKAAPVLARFASGKVA